MYYRFIHRVSWLIACVSIGMVYADLRNGMLYSDDPLAYTFGGFAVGWALLASAFCLGQLVEG